MIHSVTYLPKRPVAAIALGTTVLLLVLAPRYGWHRDEVYFLEAGHHLAWGYVDQPPFTPFVARLAELVAPENLVVLRLLPALATAVTITMGALIVRELGGTRRQIVLGAAATASCGFVLGVGHLLSTAAFDLTAWMALLWLAVRLLRTGDPRWWLAFGAVAGVAMLNKNLAVLLCGVLGVGLLAERRWELLRSPWLLAGILVALLIAAPNLVWQAQHDWPQQRMARALEARIGRENRITLLPLQLLFVGPFLVAPLVRGARWLWRAAPGFRPLLWMWPVGIVATFVTGGRPYYVLPLTITVMLAGVVATDAPAQERRQPWVVALNAAIAVPLALPILPPSSARLAANVNEAVAETIGWPTLAQQVAAVVHGLPPAEQASVILLTGSYGEAGALDLFGPDLGLPPAYSPHNSYADFRQPTEDDATVVVVRLPAARLDDLFDDCDEVGVVDNGLDVENEIQGSPILVCRGLRGHWSDVWPTLRFLS